MYTSRGFMWFHGLSDSAGGTEVNTAWSTIRMLCAFKSCASFFQLLPFQMLTYCFGLCGFECSGCGFGVVGPERSVVVLPGSYVLTVDTESVFEIVFSLVGGILILCVRGSRISLCVGSTLDVEMDRPQYGHMVIRDEFDVSPVAHVA